MATFRSWLETLVETRKTATTLGAWLGMSGAVLLLLVLAAFVEPLRGWFHLEFWSAVLSFLPMMALGLIAGSAESKGKLSLRLFGLLILFGAVLFQYFWAALIVLTTPPGSFVMACLFLLTVTLHGYLHRVTVTYPFGLAPTLLAVLGAAVLRPHSPSLPILAFVGPTGALLALMTGGVGLRMHHNVVGSDKLKQALYYRALNEKNQEYSEMSRRVLDLLKYNHDAGNTLSAVFVHAQLLEEKVAREQSLPEFERMRQPIQTLLGQLDRLRTLISHAHRVADDMPVIEAVGLSKVVSEVARDCRSLFPAVDIQLPPQREPDLIVKIHQGEVGLRRILENVLRNACEGNGSAAASNVALAIDEQDGHVSLRVSDNGPGFGEAQLGDVPAALTTTKRDGHGLGLYSVNELVVASGGALTRRNADSGGAIVEVVLQRKLSTV
ncbi:MAG: HAMP domain-containing sensor histidine kinase [Polyangiaceae bacterium]